MTTSVRQIKAARQLDGELDGTWFKPQAETKTAVLAEVMAQIDRLDLHRHVAEFEARGVTVIPPEKVGPPEFIERLREAALDVAERRYGVRPDLHGAERQGDNPLGDQVFYLLLEDPAFQEAVLNPTMLTMAHYALGRHAMLHSCLAHMKGPGGDGLALHTDNMMFPAPFPPYAQIVNFTWALTDYNLDNGGTCFVPGSHRYCRHPEPGEGLEERWVPEAPAGSLYMWHGNTWHGSFPKQTKGLRVALVTAMCRQYILPQDDYITRIPQELLDQHPAQFAQLVGQNVGFLFREEGLDTRKMATWPGKSQWD